MTAAVSTNTIMNAKPVGLVNIGSTCYMNTAIQCLIHVPAFRNCVAHLELLDSGSSSNLMAEFREIVDVMMKDYGEGVRLRPLKFAKVLEAKIKAKDLYVYEQNDIHEFVVCLMDLLNQSVARPVPAARIDRVNTALAEAKGKENMLYRFYLKCERAWHQAHLKEWSPLVDCCYGQNVLQTKCEHCKELSHVFEPCLGLTLGFGSGHKRGQLCELEAMIQDYMGRERIDGYTCDSDACKGSSRVGYRVVRMARQPAVLMLFLKRFGADGRKVDAEVKVPEVIDMGQYALQPDRACRYQLMSIGCHTGSSPHGGHYYAICRRGQQWWKIDDDEAWEVPSYTNVMSRSYYMLVYERQS